MQEGSTTRKVVLGIAAALIALLIVAMVWGIVLMLIDSVDDIVLLVGIIVPAGLLAIPLYRSLDRSVGRSASR